MTREEFKNIVKAIRAAYTNTPIDSQAVFDLWYEMLKDASYEDVSRTLENHIKANKFAPTIAELRAGTEPAAFQGSHRIFQSLFRSLPGFFCDPRVHRNRRG